jgi:hypothetical protein
MLVAHKGNFTKSNWITFTCKDGHLIEQAIQQTATGGTNLLMKSIGVDERSTSPKWILNGVK